MAEAAKKKGLNKTQVLSHFVEKTGLSRKQVGEFFDELASLATSETKKNGEFTVPGLGKLVKSQRKARTGRNPATGETIKIPAKTAVKFRVAKAVKDQIAPPKAKK